MLDLDELPATNNYNKANEFLGVANEELMAACEEWAARLKGDKDPYETFRLKKEIVERTAEEVVKRNFSSLMEHVDRQNPMSALAAIQKVPIDKPVWVLKMLRVHGLKRVELATWVAASELLGEMVKVKSMVFARKTLDKFGLGGVKF